MYRYRYINKHYQFGQTNYSLILEDLEDGMPTVRIEKSFNMQPSDIDDGFLATQANNDIMAAIQAAADAAVAAQAALDQAQSDQEDQ
jgi:hypothetical protein